MLNMRTYRHLICASLVVTSSWSQAHSLSLSEQIEQLNQIDKSHDLEINTMNLDNQPIFLFRGVQQFLDQFTEVNFARELNQNVQTELPVLDQSKSLEIVDVLSAQNCSSQDMQKKIAQEIKDTNKFDRLIESPEMVYRRKAFVTPTEENFASPESTYEVMMNFISKIEYPITNQRVSPTKLRFAQVLRFIHHNFLLELGQKTLNARKALLNEAEKGCATLKDPAVAKVLLQATEKNVALLEKIDRDAKINEQKFSTLPFSMLDREQRQTLSMYLGAYLWRFRGAGGYADMETQTRRKLFVELGFTQIGKLNGAESTVADRVASLIRWGVQTTSWGKYFDMGRLNGEKHEDFVQMEKLGRGITKAAKAYLSFESYESINLTYAGSQIGSCYYYAWEKMPAMFAIGGAATTPIWGLTGAPTGIGELCAGAGLGLALASIYQQK